MLFKKIPSPSIRFLGNNLTDSVAVERRAHFSWLLSKSFSSNDIAWSGANGSRTAVRIWKHFE